MGSVCGRAAATILACAACCACTTLLGIGGDYSEPGDGMPPDLDGAPTMDATPPNGDAAQNDVAIGDSNGADTIDGATPPLDGGLEGSVQRGYVGRVAEELSPGGSNDVDTPALRDVAAGDAIVVTLALVDTGGPVMVDDDAGNVYTLALDSTTAATTPRVVVFYSLGVRPLKMGQHVRAMTPGTTFTFVADQFTGFTHYGVGVASSGPAGAFDTGQSGTVTMGDLEYAAVVSNGDVAFTTGQAWNRLPAVGANSKPWVTTGYKFCAMTGTHSATGTSPGPWAAAFVTLTP
jgi:hypothetical protein